MSSNNQPTKEQIEAQKKVLQEKWDNAVAADAATYGPDFVKKEFTFTRAEHKQLAQQNTVKAIADNAIADLLNLYILPRAGITPSSETKITYDLTVGRFVVWIPKTSSSEEKPSSTK